MTFAFPSVILASQSPRRHRLLAQIGVAHEVLPPDDPTAAEQLEAVQAGQAPEGYVRRVTRLKLERARRQLARQGRAHEVVLCADTTVTLGPRILGKPSDAAAARRMLGLLSGTTHRVLTAVSVGRAGTHAQVLSVSEVQFAELDAATIDAYVASGEWRGKAGGYAIQGRAAALVRHISGSYSGIMGLPLFETARLLRNFVER